MSSNQPVYLRIVHEGQNLRILVEDLSMGGALLMCPVLSNSIQNGQCLRDGELVLSEGEKAQVNVVARWQIWPRIGVQFDNLSPDAASRISRLLETLKASPAEELMAVPQRG
jgi:hypothetical protein